MELFDLPLIWAFIIGFGIIMYVLMDGFDLGVGILFPFAPNEEARDTMMNSVAPVWDGNETCSVAPVFWPPSPWCIPSSCRHSISVYSCYWPG